MGDILKALGLGGQPHPAAQTAAPVPPGPVDPLAPLPEEADKIVIQGDTFRPRKQDLLSILGDAILVHGGYKPQFSQNRRDKDYRTAMEGFDQNPVRAIHRLSMLPGHQKEAQNLWDKYQDNNRADAASQSIIEARKDKARGNLGSMMGGLNEGNYSKMLPVLRKYAEARGLDPADIPDTYDADLIQTYRNGGMSVDQQVDNERADDALSSVESDRAARLGIARERLGQQGRDTDSRINLRQERVNKLRNPSGGKGPDAAKNRANKAFKTVNGSLVEYDKTGNKMKVTDKHGNVGYWTMGVNGKPVFVGRQ